MRKILLVTVFTFGMLLSLTAQNYLVEATYDSEKLSTEWNSYLETPNATTALKVYNQLPSKGHIFKETSDVALEESIYDHLNIVEEQVKQGDANNIQLAFRLFTISDGCFSEWLQEILGQTINTHPELFLTELNTHRHLFTKVNSLVGNFGEEFADDLDKQITATKRRIKNLKKVENSAVANVKKECILALKAKLKNLESLKEN